MIIFGIMSIVSIWYIYAIDTWTVKKPDDIINIIKMKTADIRKIKVNKAEIKKLKIWSWEKANFNDLTPEEKKAFITKNYSIDKKMKWPDWESVYISANGQRFYITKKGEKTYIINKKTDTKITK